MADRIDHATAAKESLIATLDYCTSASTAEALVGISTAQVHATLAVADQLRIANQIMLRAVEVHRDHYFDVERLLQEFPDIAAALGIEASHG